MIAEEAHDGVYRVLLEGLESAMALGLPLHDQDEPQPALRRRRRRPSIPDDRAVPRRAGHDSSDQGPVVARHGRGVAADHDAASPAAAMTAPVSPAARCSPDQRIVMSQLVEAHVRSKKAASRPRLKELSDEALSLFLTEPEALNPICEKYGPP
jgi:hypothetical protein